MVGGVWFNLSISMFKPGLYVQLDIYLIEIFFSIRVWSLQACQILQGFDAHSFCPLLRSSGILTDLLNAYVLLFLFFRIIQHNLCMAS